MLTSITPLGERGRGQRFAVTVVAYVIGSAAGGVVSGAALGAAGSRLVLPAVVALALASVLLLLAAAVDGRFARRLLPIGRRQVDVAWLATYRGWVYGAGYGFQLGLGAVTVVTTALLPALAVIALLTGSAATGAGLGLVFGLARAVPILATRRIAAPADLRRFAVTVNAWLSPARRAGVVTGLVGGCATGVLAVLAWT
jgi:hypothetical protein